MKRILIAAVAAACSTGIHAQENTDSVEGFVFTDEISIPVTSVKDQNKSGTCWCFSGTSFFENEIRKAGGDSLDLSEMFTVRHCYADKADRYVRMYGGTHFAAGGSILDVPYVWERYGAVPEEVYSGLNYGEDKHVHEELDGVLKAYLDVIIKKPNSKLSTAWRKGIEGILDAYLGELPETFNYNGKEYTPQSYAASLGIDPEDYVALTSFTHHPFYTEFAIEVEDNWSWDKSYNLPLEELMQVMDYAIDHGYTFVWGADVSEKGFATKDAGVAVIPATDTKEMSGAEIAKWEKLPKGQQMMDAFKQGPAPEKTITQEMRQEEFDRYQTTDDHGMHIIGKAKDQNGTPYFIVKNSWNKYNKFGGYFYASYPYMALKTMDIMVHKNAIPKAIRKKLGMN